MMTIPLRLQLECLRSFCACVSMTKQMSQLNKQCPMLAVGNVPELHGHMARETVHRERSCGVSEYKEGPGIGAKVCLLLCDPRHTLHTLHLTFLMVLMCSDFMLKIHFLKQNFEMIMSQKAWLDTILLNSSLMLSCCLCICVYACLRVCLRACVCALRRSRCCSCRGATRRCPSRLTWSCSRGCGMSCWNSSWWNISGAHRAWLWSLCPSSLPQDTLNMVWIKLWLSVVPVLLSMSVAPDL